jgi:hypothetical protein
MSSLLGCAPSSAPTPGSTGAESVSDPLTLAASNGHGRKRVTRVIHGGGQGDSGELRPPVLASGTGRVGILGPMIYHNGPLMTAATNKIYYVWYGNWTGNTAPVILDDLARNIGGSPYFAMNTTFKDGSNVAVPNAISFGGETYDSGSLGTTLVDGDVGRIVSNAITGGALPADANGIYLVLTAPNVSEGDFCSVYCGYHEWQTVNGTSIKLGFIGDAGTLCPSQCIAAYPSANQNSGADGMASVIAHEVSEAVTDPNGTGWYDAYGEENGDKCAWTFGTTYGTSNGGAANEHLGSRDYMLQMLWINGVDGMCANALTATNLACTNGVKDGNETDVDCGGSCPACSLTQHCSVDNDCSSGGCVVGTCSIAYCADGVQDHDESDVDCGGPWCPGHCGLNQSCHVAADCGVGTCLLGRCSTAYCGDGSQDYDETDVDCGGKSCSGRCGLNKNCYVASDCGVGTCLLGHCLTAYCGDGRKDYDETDVDCGGPNCAAKCATGKSCTRGSDCSGGMCDHGKCAPAYCADTTQDNDETDVDCGGPTCGGCGLNGNCYTASDCGIGACLLGRCRNAYCGDGSKDYDEADVDCGGPSCTTKCGDGKHCAAATDCASGMCVASKCQPSHCANGTQDGDETDVDCGGPSCQGCGLNASCYTATDCRVGRCLLGRCLTAYCADGRKDYDETDVDCGGPFCVKCTTGNLCTTGTDCASGTCTSGHCQ